ncbi:MAG: flippase-like domain-containing protein [Candidatus Micrarchaeota archaeon]|nr:flippase-like domain-containing protein [Candidatus Micrarchaeota archaeon]
MPGLGEGSNIKDRKSYEHVLKKGKYFVYFFLFVSLAVFVAISISAIYEGGIEKFVQTVESFNFSYFVAAVVLVLVGITIRFPKWHIYMKALRVKVSIVKNYLIYLSLYSMNVTPARSGRLVASYTLNRVTGEKLGRTAPAVVADIFTDFLGYMIMMAAVTILVGQYQPVFIILSVIALVPFIIILDNRPYLFVKGKLKKVRYLKGFFNFGDSYFESSRMFDKKVYLYSLVFTIPSEAMFASTLYLIILGFGIPMPVSALPIILFIYASSVLVGLISGIPGTIGVTELGILGYLTLLLKINYVVAAAITIVFSLSTLWFAEIVGFVALRHTLRYWDI